MPLHEYLEQKRVQNIAQLNADGACHICGSTCRSSRGFSEHVLGNQIIIDGQSSYCNENSMVKPRSMAAMRTCSCFGIPDTDPDYCPHSIRVCDRCIEDDKGIGRIRICGACGTVACDEYCGPLLLECTDSPEWNNAGCLECRRLGDFSEMDIFKRSINDKKEPRMTRICIKCLKQSAPWVSHDFVCRRFHCETRLVLSDIVERKRCTTFGTSPLNLLPEDGLVAVVDFLSGSDLTNLFFSCSAMCTVAERTAMNKVMNINDFIPTGPIIFETTSCSKGISKEVMRLGGSNSFGLRAPDDEKAWVGVYHYVEKLVKEMFYFTFQMEGIDADREAVGRYITESRDEKFTFGQIYNVVERDMLIEHPTVGISVMVRGGTVLVTEPELSGPVVFACSRPLDAGIHRVICRLHYPVAREDPRSRALARVNESSKLGYIGIVTSNLTGNEPTFKWSAKKDFIKPGGKADEVAFGLAVEYKDDVCKVSIQSDIHHRLPIHLFPDDFDFTIKGGSGDLHYIAVELASPVLSEQQALLSVRYCDDE
ncbi:hypothetical protein ACHAXH_004351, partial [Discostella pseudostelligera]